MRFSQLSSTSITIAALCSVSTAWPLFQLHEKRNPLPAPQSYSVVPVDGGAGVNAGTRTITNVVTQTQVQTVISTVTVGGSERPVTVINTQVIPTTIVQLVPITVAGETKTMVVAPSVTSVPYDDGQWHGTYYYRSTLTDVLVPVSTTTPLAVAAASPSTTMRVNSAASMPSSSRATTASSSTITAAPQNWVAVTTSTPQSSSTIDWAHHYGTWRDTPKNGSWWGKRVVEKVEAGLARFS